MPFHHIRTAGFYSFSFFLHIYFIKFFYKNQKDKIKLDAYLITIKDSKTTIRTSLNIPFKICCVRLVNLAGALGVEPRLPPSEGYDGFRDRCATITLSPNMKLGERAIFLLLFRRVEERVGFEPTGAHHVCGFQDRCTQPLYDRVANVASLSARVDAAESSITSINTQLG